MKHKGFNNFKTGTLWLSSFQEMAKYNLDYREPCMECYTIYGPDKYEGIFRFIHTQNHRRDRRIKNSYYKRIGSERNFYNFKYCRQLSIREASNEGDM